MGEAVFKSSIEFLHLGGYGVYVWPCYLISVLVIGWQLSSALRQLRAVKHKIYAQHE